MRNEKEERCDEKKMITQRKSINLTATYVRSEMHLKGKGFSITTNTTLTDILNCGL
jgi:hypothetical protein